MPKKASKKKTARSPKPAAIQPGDFNVRSIPAEKINPASVAWNVACYTDLQETGQRRVRSRTTIIL